jgi:hypothetical protein
MVLSSHATSAGAKKPQNPRFCPKINNKLYPPPPDNKPLTDNRARQNKNLKTSAFTPKAVIAPFHNHFNTRRHTMKTTKPTNILALAAGIALIAALAFTACDNGTKSTTETEQKPSTPQTLAPTTVSFVSLGDFSSGTSVNLNFSPSAALPTGVTYKLTDNIGGPTRNSASGFNGQVNSSEYSSVGPITFTQTFYFNGQEITGTGSKRTVVVVFDDFPSPQFITLTSDTGSVTLQYPNTALTKTITVPAITFVPGNTLDFGAVSALTGWDADFPASDVTYTVTLSKNGSIVATFESTSTTSISASGRPDGIYTLTQTFKYKGNAISGGSRSMGIEIDGNNFTDMYVSETNFGTGSFPALTLNLSK